MKTVNVHKAKTELSKLLTEVEAGGEFVIARGNKPIARVVPFESREKKRRVPGALAHLRGNMPPDLFLQPLSEEELAAWEGKYSFDWTK